jgi:hypothetical protein
MIKQMIIRLFYTATPMNTMVLGRWGYHWDKTLKYNKYYD